MKQTAAIMMILLGLSALNVHAEWLGPDAKDPKSYMPRDLLKILNANPLSDRDNFKLTPLYENSRSKHVLVQVRDREPPHIHADSDITVWMLRGKGVVHIVDKKYPVKVGDIIHIPRGVMHYYVNGGPEVGVVLVVYSPAPGPKDRVIVKDKSK